MDGSLMGYDPLETRRPTYAGIKTAGFLLWQHLYYPSIPTLDILWGVLATFILPFTLLSKRLILTLLICFRLENCFKPLRTAHHAVLADGQRVQQLLLDSAIQCHCAHRKQEEGVERNTYIGVRYFNWSPSDALVHRLVTIEYWIHEVRGKSRGAQTKDFKSVWRFINYLTECPLALQSLSGGKKGL